MGTRWHGGRQQITFGPQAAPPNAVWRFVAAVALLVIVAEVLGTALAALTTWNGADNTFIGPTSLHAHPTLPPAPGR